VYKLITVFSGKGGKKVVDNESSNIFIKKKTRAMLDMANPPAGHIIIEG